MNILGLSDDTITGQITETKTPKVIIPKFITWKAKKLKSITSKTNLLHA